MLYLISWYLIGIIRKHNITLWIMCVFLTLSHPSTRRHPAHPVSVRILCRREILADWSQKLRHRAQREYSAMFRYAVLCSKLGVRCTKNQIMISDCCGKFTGHFDTPLVRTYMSEIVFVANNPKISPQMVG